MASKRRTRRKMQRNVCQRKKAFPTEAAAKHATWLTRKANKRPGHGRAGSLWPYKCKFCGRWHIGHKNKKFGVTTLIDQVNR